MNTSRFLLLLVISALLVYEMQVLQDSRGGESRSAEEFMYLPQPEIIRRLSFGHEGLLADIYWLRTVQYYGEKRRAAVRQSYQLLEPLLRITTALDPQMILAYRFGAIFLSEPQPIGPNEAEKALALLDDGIGRNPGSWQLLFDKGFIYFWQLKEYRKAADWFLRGSRCLDAPDWLGALAAFAMERGGDIETSRYLWTKQYEASSNENMRSNAMSHLHSLKVDEDLWTLEILLERFQELHQRPAASWTELIRAGLLRSAPVDPLGDTYQLTAEERGPGLSPRSSIKRFPLPDEVRERFKSQIRQRFGLATRKEQ